ncbi:MAG TPA: transglutaminase family protein, partial [Pirellulales bacterium]
MSIRVALNHVTHYRYDRLVTLGPQVVRLRPAPHARTPITGYSLKITPAQHFINWQQDPQGNFLARLVFEKPTTEFRVEVDLVADVTRVNPFDFFLEPSATDYPFEYEKWLAKELRPFLETDEGGPELDAFVESVDRTPRKVIDFIVGLNQKVHHAVGYVIRLEPGVQTAEETLCKASGSCRDSAWLLVQCLRRLGFAARFASGYLIQLTADEKSLDGPSGTEVDFTDLHAWTEVYLPGAGWIGLDPTSGLLTGEGHIPLACSPDPQSAAPISGGVDECETEFEFHMSVTRIHEDPRVTKPYDEETWEKIERLGHLVDQKLNAGDVRLTMGGEPTFVSIDDMEGAEWNLAAMGPTKRLLSGDLMRKLMARFGKNSLLHIGTGKWYPGESLPRWSMGMYWRRDGQPIWLKPELYADEHKNYGYDAATAHRFATTLAERIKVGSKWLVQGFEDTWYYLWKERRLPINVDPFKSNLKDKEERERLARVFEKGLNSPVGTVMPIRRAWINGKREWVSGPWPVRPEHMFLIPGDSPMGLRLPLDSLPYLVESEKPEVLEVDPLAKRGPLPERPRQMSVPVPERERSVREYIGQGAAVGMLGELRDPLAWQPELDDPESLRLRRAGGLGGDGYLEDDQSPEAVAYRAARNGHSNGNGSGGYPQSGAPFKTYDEDGNYIVRTALCVEPREGRLYIFMPPCESIEDYLELAHAIEDVADLLQTPVVLEGYNPPNDPRINNIKITPDPGVIEVNVHPAHNWDELVTITTGLYEDARSVRLGTEKFMLDGRHTGTGGGNHIVMGGATAADSPFLRRPQLLKSLIGYWHNHPSLSYLFSGLFIGPTSQAPRVDEGRADSTYELQIAFEQVPTTPGSPPWLIDRLFRNLLTDLTGNTHRAEFCIDKLYSPDFTGSRLGLVEFRAFEMPPHARMSLTQQLLLRALVARFWDNPYQEKLSKWTTTLHDRFMLPYFVEEDFEDVIEDLRQAGFPLDVRWFDPHFEFRFPKIGEMTQRSIQIELRTAIEPW